jgi:hypothetical protein
MGGPIQRDVLDEHYTAVGKCISGWSMLEFDIDTLIWDMANVAQPLGACITSQIVSIGARIRVLRALVEIRIGENKKIDERLQKFARVSAGYQEKRNRIAHDAMIFNTGTGEVSSVRAAIVDNKLDYGPTPIPLSEMNEFINQIGVHGNHFAQLDKDIRALVEPLQGKWSRQFSEMRHRWQSLHPENDKPEPPTQPQSSPE